MTARSTRKATRRPPPPPQAAAVAEHSGLPLVVTILQFAAVVGLVWLFHLESVGLTRVLLLALGGFVIHHLLPLRMKLPFFALLSVASLPLVLGWRPAALVAGFTMFIVALCHLPVPFGIRVGSVLSFGAALAFLRTREIATIPPVIWPVIGAMLMFRLAVYLYDLRHDAAPFTPWHAAAYFAMIPNVAFTLFPVVDYKTFCRSHYNDQPARIYQVGIVWMLRGIAHLLLYRLLYQNFLVDPGSATTTGDVAQYVLTTFFLYLRISGTFHLIIGLLHMFGFNLPETHHLYFLSSSFTDFWRRINIYWKDFIMKLVFYPVYFRIRKIGETRAMAAASMVAFAATWLLHSYQWFWIRGQFPMTWQDFVFWMGLAVLVVVNMLREARLGRERRLTAKKRTAGSDLALAARTVGTFAVICLLWTIWSTPSARDLRVLAAAAVNVDARGIGIVISAAMLVGLAAVLIGRREREHTEGNRAAAGVAPFRFGRAAARAAMFAVVLFAAGLVPELFDRDSHAAAIASRLRENRLNDEDTQRLERGYYEELGDVTRFNDELGSLYGNRPRGWGQNPAMRSRGDFLGRELAPGVTAVFKGATLTTNSWGMRDREYSREKPPGVYRIAQMGASHEMGAGVADDEVYSSVLERRLNESGRYGSRIEILNFAVGGYSSFQKLGALERKALAFDPDALFYTVHSGEFDAISRHDFRVRSLEDIPYEPLRQVIGDAGLSPRSDPDELERAIEPHARELMQFVFGRATSICRERQMDCYLVLLRLPNQITRPETLDELAVMGRRAGFRVLDLWGAYEGVDRERLYITSFDYHPNAEGHRLLADRLESEFRSQWRSGRAAPESNGHTNQSGASRPFR